MLILYFGILLCTQKKAINIQSPKKEQETLYKYSLCSRSIHGYIDLHVKKVYRQRMKSEVDVLL